MVNSVWDKRCILSPSLICMDMLNLQKQVKECEAAGIEMLHIDILDGHFSPSMPLGFETVRQLKNATPLPLECHVMVNAPEYFVNELIDIGVEQIVFHIETAPHVDGLISRIHKAGVRAGVALKPATPLTSLEYIIEKCDSVLLMQINPGYASSKEEKKITYMDRKIRDLREMIRTRGLNTKIILDGRVSLEDVACYGRDCVDIFVGGTTCMNRTDIHSSVARFKEVRDRL